VILLALYLAFGALWGIADRAWHWLTVRW